MKGINIRFTNLNDAIKTEFLAQMINHVYDVSEGNIWIDSYKRTSKKQLLKLIEKQELILAEKNEEIYGCVWLEKVNNEVYKFKMLVTNPKYLKLGIGTMLIQFVENYAKTSGASKMTLELLVPTQFEHPDKVFLMK